MDLSYMILMLLTAVGGYTAGLIEFAGLPGTEAAQELPDPQWEEFRRQALAELDAEMPTDEPGSGSPVGREDR